MSLDHYSYLFIDSFAYRKGDPIPQINFTDVKLYCGVDPDHILLHPEEQIRSSPGNELKVFYFRIKRGV